MPEGVEVNPARVVVEETRRSFAYLSLYGVATDAVLTNRVLPPDAAHGYFARWAEREAHELGEIEASFPVPILQAPLYPHEVVGADALRRLGTAIYGERDPAGVFTIACKDEHFVGMTNGTVDGSELFMSGELIFQGDMNVAMSMQGLLF